LWTCSLPHRGADATLYITADAAKTHRARLAKLRTKNPVQLISQVAQDNMPCAVRPYSSFNDEESSSDT
jgi:hypothetical protein